MKNPLKQIGLVLSLLAFTCTSAAQNTSAKNLTAEYSFTIEATISDALMMGETIDGKRLSIPITGGRFYGNNIRGKVLPGGADYQLIRQDGATSLHAVYMLKTDDGALINVINSGVLVPKSDNQDFYFRTTPTFTAPNGQYSWLNKSIFVGGVRVSADKKNTVFIDVYRLE